MVTACDIYKGLDFTLYSLRFLLSVSSFHFLLSVSSFRFLLSVFHFHFSFFVTAMIVNCLPNCIPNAHEMHIKLSTSSTPNRACKCTANDNEMEMEM